MRIHCDIPTLAKGIRRLAALTAALMSICSTAAAEPEQRIYYDHPVYDTSRPERLVEIRPYVAVGMSTALQNYGKAIQGVNDVIMSPGPMMRTGIDVQFGLVNSWGVGTGMSFDISNNRSALSIIDNNTGSINSIYTKNHYTNLHIPVYLSCRLFISRRLKFNVDAGTYTSLGLGGTSHISGYTSGENSIGQPVITHIQYSTDYYDAKQPVINSVKKKDIGLHFATGFTYRNHFSLGLLFECSVKNLAQNFTVIDARYRHMTIGLEFGYGF